RLRADVMAPDRIRPPGLVEALVEEVARTDPRGTGGDALDDVVEELARAQGLDAQRVALVADDVDRVRQQRAVDGDGRRAQRENLVALGQLVEVEEDLLPRHRLARRG